SRLIPASIVKSDNRPLEMLTLGDSVVWGQGLKPENKFSHLVCEWLGKRTDRQVHFHNEAHSGATIYPETDNGAAFHGEINVSSPSIFQQIKNSSEYYKNRNDSDGGKLAPETVDLILIDGGINDTHATNILFSTQQKISGKAKEYCYEGMSKLLSQTVKTYPNARIVVTGYFPLVSALSKETEVLNVVLTVIKENKIQTVLSKFAKKLLDKTPDQFHFIHNALTTNSDMWYAESNRRLKQSMDELNGKNKNPTFSATNPQFLFVEVPFQPKNCYAVDETTFLWRIKAKTATNDDIFEEREKICSIFKDNPFQEIVCRRAGAFHPNVNGAKAYATAIETKLEGILEKTTWKS
ncbi:MAG: GDSL-type esterase/lipase family protein, partial [Acidobacteriota bacterium]|nr:GDSL-type esterase/lipase family protein [Acidobacteriota bacterium]